jgi:hypothetical protein
MKKCAPGYYFRIFRCRMDSGDPNHGGHEHVKERYEEGVVRFFIGLFGGEFLVD